MKEEIVLEDETPRSESSQSAPWKQQDISMNSSVANDAARVKLKGHLIADMHRNERKV